MSYAIAKIWHICLLYKLKPYIPHPMSCRQKSHFFVKLQYEHQSTHLKVNILKKWAVEMEGQSKWYKIISNHYAEIPVTFNNHQLTQEIEVRYLKMHVYWELYWKDNTGSTNSRKCTGTLKGNPNSRWKAKYCSTKLYSMRFDLAKNS